MLEIAVRLRADVREQVGLPITVGVARTKFLAKVASRVAKPDGLLVVPVAGLLDFLQQHDVRVALADLGDRALELDWRMVRVGFAPDPPELHVELHDPEFAHGPREPQPIFRPLYQNK